MDAIRKWVILLAEDDPDDQMFARRAVILCNQHIRLHIVEDGEELMLYLRRQGEYADPLSYPRPDLVLLDLNMPRKSGREALREIKSDPNLRRIPVVVMTTSSAHLDITDAYDRGTNAYVVKPLEYERLCDAIKALGLFWFETARLSGT
jgi:two-component system, response regulator